MPNIIKLENSIGRDLQICVEPFLDYIDWDAGKVAEIELNRISDAYQDDLNIAFTEQGPVIYWCRQFEMKIFIDKELKYSQRLD